HVAVPCLLKPNQLCTRLSWPVIKNRNRNSARRSQVRAFFRDGPPEVFSTQTATSVNGTASEISNVFSLSARFEKASCTKSRFSVGVPEMYCEYGLFSSSRRWSSLFGNSGDPFLKSLILSSIARRSIRSAVFFCS